MSIKSFINSLRKEKECKVSEPYLCKFTVEQMTFIVEESKIYGTKAAVIRKCLQYFIDHKKEQSK